MVVIVGTGIGSLVGVVMTVLVRGFDATFDRRIREAIGWYLLTILLFGLILAGGITLAILFTNSFSH